jgi:hypothetical protein
VAVACGEVGTCRKEVRLFGFAKKWNRPSGKEVRLFGFAKKWNRPSGSKRREMQREAKK